MGDGHDAALVLQEEVLEPGHRLGVEMVGGLVEEQHVRGLEEKAAQSHAASLAARELRDVGVSGRQAQGVHRDLDVAVQLPEVPRVDLVLEARKLVGGLVGVVGRQLLVAIEDGPLVGHRLLDVLLDVLLRVELRLLGQVADARPLGRERLSGEVLVEPGHDPKQRRLPRAVGTDHADLGVRIEGEPDPLEDLLPLGRDLAKVLHGEDVLLGHLALVLLESKPHIVAQAGSG